MRVRDDAGAAGRLHLEAVLDRGKRHVSASSPEDAGDDDRLHLLRTHGDGHENLHSREKARKVSLEVGAVSERGTVANGDQTFFFGQEGEEMAAAAVSDSDETAAAAAESLEGARAKERGGGDLIVE